MAICRSLRQPRSVGYFITSLGYFYYYMRYMWVKAFQTCFQLDEGNLNRMFFPAKSELVLFTYGFKSVRLWIEYLPFSKVCYNKPQFLDKNKTALTLQLGQTVIFFFCRSVLCSLLNTKPYGKIPFRKASASFMLLWSALLIYRDSGNCNPAVYH